MPHRRPVDAHRLMHKWWVFEHARQETEIALNDFMDEAGLLGDYGYSNKEIKAVLRQIALALNLELDE